MPRTSNALTDPLRQWSGPAFDPSLAREELLHELFEASADACPSAVAIECGGAWLTYAELEKSANQLAHHLRALGVGRGAFVGLLLERSAEVFVALLAVLKAGAAYVPLDPDYPADRVEFILNDSGASVVLTQTSLAAKCGAAKARVLCLDAERTAPSVLPDSRLSSAETGATHADACYVIYTSGTTGRPKGVLIEHRSAGNLVRAEGKIFKVRPDDKIYQGFSIAFDASVEEVWLAFFAGATLVAATREWIQSGPELARRLTAAGVTVFSTVPTLLAMLEGDLPTVRLLILGGEACPRDLVTRWAKPGRRMVNTYGPTEATVIATFGECDPAKPVTIGRAVPNYRVFILDENLRALPPGESGELCIGGIGVARGYVGRLELTAEKFVPNPFEDDGRAPRLYRTGDLVRWTSEGEIEFLGRIDSQVKIRGFRVELSEIESVLLECAGVRAAAVALREDTPGLQQLVAYVVPRGGESPNFESIRAALRARLPGYMMPAVFETLAELPTLPSGKVDRKALPRPKSSAASERADAVAPRNASERRLHECWTRLFAPTPVSVTDDFFLDLGGHSLLAARMVSELRRDDAFKDLSILDVYQSPTLEALAAKLDTRRAPTASAAPKRERYSASAFAHFRCGALQLLGLYLIMGFFSVQWLAPYLTYTHLAETGYEIYEAILGSLGILLGVYPAMLAFTIVAKWVIIGRYRAGRYPLWGIYYFRFWLANTLQATVPVGYLTGTPLLGLYYRLMGARIGANVFFGTDNLSAYDLLRVGDDTSLGADASLPGYTVEDGWLILGEVKIGARCFVGNRAVIGVNATMEDDAKLEDLSLLPAGKTIARGERWVGSPGRAERGLQAATTADGDSASKRPEGRAPSVRPRFARRFAFGCLHALGLFLFPSLVIAAIYPGLILLNQTDPGGGAYAYLWFAPLVALSFIVLLCVEIAVLKWLVLGRVRAGRYPLHSWFYLRKWFVDQTLELSLDIVGPLYATMFLNPWYRLLGAKLGRRAEISTASFISPDLLTLGDETFIADSVSLGAARVENGFLLVGENRVGHRSFIGNSAALPPGSVIGDNSLVGCLSVPPANPADAARNDASWFGSPAVFLPQRQASTAFAEEQLFKPTRKLWLQRALIEFIRVLLPSTGFIVLTSLLISAVLPIRQNVSLAGLVLVFPLLYAACGVAAMLSCVALKWLLVGRYRPSEHPLWCPFVWRTELVTSTQENFANQWLVALLAGTPFVCWVFRLLGTKIGRRVFMETTDLTEFDLVIIGDEACLNMDCTIQTHLFEDRVMKMSTIEIGPRAHVGALSLVLYDTRIEADAALGELSLLMKGETLPAGTRWEGSPARRAVD
ncbi:MAG: amino acid adenylation domain-containing protein [Verrucomicrobia bacterium]|nr:amino acid adenylation domain-containing protein [Verrucomicrobiota bacterium]